MPSPRLLALPVLLSALTLGCAAAPPASTADEAPAPSAAGVPALPLVPPSDATGLVPIAPGERHLYRLDSAAGRWLSVELWQREADLSLRVRDPAGEEIAASAVPGNWSVEVVELTVARDGRHVFEVAAPDDGRPASYRLRLVRDRPARPDDAARLAARREARELARGRRSGQVEPGAAAAALRRLLDGGVDWTAEERAEIARELGDALLAAGDVDGAAAAYRDGLDALRAPPAGALAADLLRGLALAAQDAERFDEALRSFREAAAVADAAGEHAVLGSALVDEARFLLSRGDLAGAIERAAEAAAAKSAGGDLAGEVVARLDLVTLLWMRGDPAASLLELERTTRLAEEAAVEDSDTRFRLPLIWSAHHRANGEVDRTITALERALEAAVTAGNADGEMHSRLHLGALHNQLGDYADARALLLRAAELAQAHGSASDRAAVSVQLGWAALGEGDAAAARERLLRTVEEPTLRLDSRVAALHALATAHIELAEHAAAQERLAEAVRLAAEGNLRLLTVDLRRALGSLHLDTGDLDAAAESIGQAMTGAAEVEDPLREAAAASLLARVAAERGDPAAALGYARRAIELREEVRSGIAEPSLRASFLARWRSDFELAIEMLLLLSRGQAADDPLRQAFLLSEAAHARTLSELLAEAKIDVRSGVAEHLLEAQNEAERRLSQVQRRLTLALAKAADAEQIATLEGQRWQAQRTVEAVDASIRREHPRYADLHRPRPPGVEEVQAWLDDETAVIEYALGERSSALFVVTRRDFAAYELPPAEEIADRVGTVRDLLGASALESGRLAAELEALSGLLLAPAARHLAEVDRLLVVPDRDLFYLPFEALTDPGDPSAARGGALRRWTITYLPSAAVIAHFVDARPVEWQREVLIFADPPALVVAGSAAERSGESHLVPSGGLGSLAGARRE
ncbi:MAG TPA: hypothetical protein VF100_03240, partial [Thermoanaerobaculia bacterium]